MDYKAYYERMDLAMEQLVQAMYTPSGKNVCDDATDAAFVIKAAKKIQTFRNMLIAVGISPGIIDAIMDE